MSIGVSLYSGLLWGREAVIRSADTYSVWVAFHPLLPISLPQTLRVERVWKLNMTSFPCSSQDFYGSWNCVCWGTGAPCYNDWIPKCYLKATKRLFSNQVPLGAGEPCCLTFLPGSHLGEGRTREVPSTIHFHASWCAQSFLRLLMIPLLQYLCLSSLTELLSCSDGSRAMSGGGEEWGHRALSA